MESQISQTESLIGLIEQLVEPAAPPPIPMVPQTWGWAVLAILLLALLAFGVWRWSHHRRTNAYRREALKLLSDVGDDPARIAQILRRVALAAYPRESVASLSGAAWLGFLDRQTGGTTFTQGPGQAIADAPWRPIPVDPELTRLAENWVRRHRRGG